MLDQQGLPFVDCWHPERAFFIIRIIHKPLYTPAINKIMATHAPRRCPPIILSHTAPARKWRMAQTNVLIFRRCPAHAGYPQRTRLALCESLDRGWWLASALHLHHLFFGSVLTLSTPNISRASATLTPFLLAYLNAYRLCLTFPSTSIRWYSGFVVPTFSNPDAL